MKKKYRDITVDNKQYAWMVKNGELIIWYNKVILTSSDVTHVIVTPKYVADQIKMINNFDKISVLNH